MEIMNRRTINNTCLLQVSWLASYSSWFGESSSEIPTHILVSSVLFGPSFHTDGTLKCLPSSKDRYQFYQMLAWEWLCSALVFINLLPSLLFITLNSIDSYPFAGLFMALQPKIIACGKSVATFSMAVRFLTGPAVMAATSIAVGLRGVLLHVAIVQAALPQGIVPFVFAKEYNVHADILSTAWVLLAFKRT